jgi:hypothetical protein
MIMNGIAAGSGAAPRMSDMGAHCRVFRLLNQQPR